MTKALLPIAVLVGAALIAAVIARRGPVARYDLAQGADGLVIRLDRFTGETSVCVVQRDATGRYVAPCDGTRN